MARVWESLPKSRPRVDSSPRRLACPRLRSRLSANPQQVWPQPHCRRPAPVRGSRRSITGGVDRFGLAAEALSSAASSVDGYAMDHRPPNPRAEPRKRRREGTGRPTARSSTPFTGGASTATIDVTSAPRDCCRPTPGGCRLAGVLPVRDGCPYAPLVPEGGGSRRALTAFPQVRAQKPTGRGDRI